MRTSVGDGIEASRASRCGLTLIELLVVVAVVGILLGLLTAGVQEARESASRVQCANNLHQIGLGFQTYRDQYDYFPSAGWGWAWIGNPNLGTGPRQPGGWLYQILPFIDQSDLHDLGLGTSTAEAATQLVNTRVAIYNCPSRRNGGPYPNNRSATHFSDGVGGVYHFGNIDFWTPEVMRADYAVNVGSQDLDEFTPGPATLAEGLSPGWLEQDTAAKYNGIVFLLSRIGVGNVANGTSNVYLVGERYLNVSHYTTGNDIADNETMFAGFDNDNCRCTAAPPQRDMAQVSDSKVFGSAHRVGFNMCYCDGSVRFIEFGIDPAVHLLAGQRAN
jgi:prepilin-type N-terminal cleavage/methylation domain-containing protein/prepilin-type processing-associated H-X9-DG protein